MRILAVGDFHGKFPARLKTAVKGCDLILCTGDICSADKIEWKYWKELRAGKKLEEIIGVDRLRKLLAKQILKSKRIVGMLDSLDVPVVIVYGNGDMTNAYFKRYSMKLDGIEKFVHSSKNIRLMRCGRCKFAGITILCHSGYRGYTAKKGDENGKMPEKSRIINKKWKEDIRKLAALIRGEFIFLTHDVPLGKLDKIDNPKSPVNGEHVGDEFYLRFDRKYQPLLHICGHMHENRGTEKVGRTMVINPGAAFEGNAASINMDEKIKIKFVSNL